MSRSRPLCRFRRRSGDLFALSHDYAFHGQIQIEPWPVETLSVADHFPRRAVALGGLAKCRVKLERNGEFAPVGKSDDHSTRAESHLNRPHRAAEPLAA